MTLACGMIFSRGSMLRLSKSGAVCSRQSAFARMRMAFFCCLNIAVVLVSDVQAYTVSWCNIEGVCGRESF